MAWKETGLWTVRDEDGRLHWRDCACVEQDGENACRSRTFEPFPTEALAQRHAARLEAVRGYACTAYPFQVR
jgi:hypothetical protein